MFIIYIVAYHPHFLILIFSIFVKISPTQKKHHLDANCTKVELLTCLLPRKRIFFHFLTLSFERRLYFCFLIISQKRSTKWKGRAQRWKKICNLLLCPYANRSRFCFFIGTATKHSVKSPTRVFTAIFQPFFNLLKLVSGETSVVSQQ